MIEMLFPSPCVRLLNFRPETFLRAQENVCAENSHEVRLRESKATYGLFQNSVQEHTINIKFPGYGRFNVPLTCERFRNIFAHG